MITLEQLSGQVGGIVFGTVFVVFGLISATIAAIRREKTMQIVFSLSVWSGMYGIRLLILTPAVKLILPQLVQSFIPYLDVGISYFTLVFALLAWQNFTLGLIRQYIQIAIAAGIVVGLLGIGWFMVTGSKETFMIYNSLLAASVLVILVIVLTIKRLSDKYLILPNRGVLLFGTLLFAGEALYSNLSRFFGYPTWPITGWLGFAVFLVSLSFVAARIVFKNERRLYAIEVELETARQIQSSILPALVPDLENLVIYAAYKPMAAVAGDFYDFICIDSQRNGFFVADVSGHGVPAALIASMIKIAIHSVLDVADKPSEVMRRLCNILGAQLKGQFVTAAYLYVDTSTGKALYSAAGHPPLLYWNSAIQQLQSIESNGLLLGFLKDQDYPEKEIIFKGGDRFILYTDGLTEVENTNEQLFGEYRLPDIIRNQTGKSAKQLGENMLQELKLWQTSQDLQQDDITWIIIDISEPHRKKK